MKRRVETEPFPTWSETTRELRARPARLALGGAWASATALGLAGLTGVMPVVAVVLFVSWSLNLLMGMRYETRQHRIRERYMTAADRLGVAPTLSVWARLRSALPRALVAFGATIGFGMIAGWFAGTVTQDVFLGVTAMLTIVGSSAIASLILLGVDVVGANPGTEHVAAQEEAQRVTHAAHGDLAGGLAISAISEGGDLSVQVEAGGLEPVLEEARDEVVFAFDDEVSELAEVAPAHHDQKRR